MSMRIVNNIMGDFGYSYSCHHYVCYLVADMFLDRVTFIQKWYRRRLFRSSIYLHFHKKKYNHCVYDIFEYGFTPPVHDIPLLRNGGYIYRESIEDFEKLRI